MQNRRLRDVQINEFLMKKKSENICDLQEHSCVCIVVVYNSE